MLFWDGLKTYTDPVDPAQVFLFLREKGHVVSLVGGGGKTSLMYAFAEACAKQGWKVLVATTTKIYKPEASVCAYSAEEVYQLWGRGSYAVLGQDAPGGKLMMPPQERWDLCMKKADVVFLEADGAKEMPAKVPSFKEPVILPPCDTVVGVMGMDALDQPLEKVCFRLEETKALLGAYELAEDGVRKFVENEELLTADRMVTILSSERGTRKSVEDRDYQVILNKCDTRERRERGAEILKKLSQRGIPGFLSCREEYRK